MMWDVIPNKKGPIKMLTQKMQETITRFKKNRKAATLTQEEALQKSRSNLLKPLVEPSSSPAFAGATATAMRSPDP